MSTKEAERCASPVNCWLTTPLPQEVMMGNLHHVAETATVAIAGVAAAACVACAAAAAAVCVACAAAAAAACVACAWRGVCLVKLLACGHHGVGRITHSSDFSELAYPDWGLRGFSGVLTGVSLGGLQEIFAPPRQGGECVAAFIDCKSSLSIVSKFCISRSPVQALLDPE